MLLYSTRDCPWNSDAVFGVRVDNNVYKYQFRNDFSLVLKDINLKVTAPLVIGESQSVGSQDE